MSDPELAEKLEHWLALATNDKQQASALVFLAFLSKQQSQQDEWLKRALKLTAEPTLVDFAQATLNLDKAQQESERAQKLPEPPLSEEERKLFEKDMTGTLAVLPNTLDKLEAGQQWAEASKLARFLAARAKSRSAKGMWLMDAGIAEEGQRDSVAALKLFHEALGLSLWEGQGAWIRGWIANAEFSLALAKFSRWMRQQVDREAPSVFASRYAERRPADPFWEHFLRLTKRAGLKGFDVLFKETLELAKTDEQKAIALTLGYPLLNPKNPKKEFWDKVLALTDQKLIVKQVHSQMATYKAFVAFAKAEEKGEEALTAKEQELLVLDESNAELSTAATTVAELKESGNLLVAALVAESLASHGYKSTSRRSQYLQLAGDLYNKRKDYEAAMSLFQRALELSPAKVDRAHIQFKIALTQQLLDQRVLMHWLVEKNVYEAP